MATTNTPPVTEDTLITVKITFDDCTKRLKLPLKDLGASVLPARLRQLLCIVPDQPVIFERYSDSAGGYVVLDPANPAVFKTLMRAAKAKLKLRLRASAPSSATTQSDGVGAEGPVIARTPVYVPTDRNSTALDQHSVGPGIFAFRDTLVSPHQQSGVDEAPVPCPFDFVANQGPKHTLALRARPNVDIGKTPWAVHCNMCDKVLANVHYHCSICSDGDFDLCHECLGNGKACPGQSHGHWLIKRFIQNGKVVSSTTERIAPKPRAQPVAELVAKLETEREMPGAFTDDARTLAEKLDYPIRTCNACVTTLPEHEFVTCMQCEDYDLCRGCHTDVKHGHHPGHHFKPAVDGTELSLAEEALLPAGRNIRHNAICDGCNKAILGVRHKCFNCPDFDYCGVCFKTARHTHPRHRFAALYDPLPARRTSSVEHHGIFCDGPLCKSVNQNQMYIRGVRYKCVVCHDVDFCEACEALPSSFHNKTHPMVKFKTPVNNLSISTESENPNGVVRKLGDRTSVHHYPKSVFAVSASPKPASNVTIPVRTVADIKPSPQVEEKKVEVAEVSASVAEPIPVVESARSANSSTPTLHGQFISDRIPDGTLIAPNTRFTQVWTIRNPGPSVWPAGCSIRFVGGDNMLNVDNTHASSVSDIADATESNVIGREVQPGEDVGFAVLMKSPMREGKCISYWRLKSADGTPFGHRLWCDINVKALESPRVSQRFSQAPSQPINIPLGASQSYYALYKQRMNALKSHIDQTATGDQKTPVQPVVEAGVEAQSTEKLPTEAQKPESTETEQDEGEMKGSQMIFPTLDKESPSSSTYQSLSGSETNKSKHEEIDLASPSSEASSNVALADNEGFEEVSDDLEVLSAMDEAESDDGFLTDEEYDVLDASDQETIASMK